MALLEETNNIKRVTIPPEGKKRTHLLFDFKQKTQMSKIHSLILFFHRKVKLGVIMLQGP